jgi:hypothetical protein
MNRQPDSRIDTYELRESVEVFPPDFALAYAALARRMAAIDAILASGEPPNSRLFRAQQEASMAMKTIEQVETPVMLINPRFARQNDLDGQAATTLLSQKP